MAHQIDAQGPGTEAATPRSPVSSPGAPRLSFRVKVALVWITIFIVLGVFFALAKFDWAWMRANFKFIATGLWVTMFAAVCSIAIAVVLALFGALARLSKNPIAYGVSSFYTSFFRGTPLIVQLFIWYLAVPQVAGNILGQDSRFYRYTVLSAILAGILGLGFNYGAYMTEIFRAGILAVGPGQTEAAEALGMTYRQRMRRIVLPQAFKVIIPPTGNEFIAMMKDTALLSFLGAAVFWWDLFKRAQTLALQEFKGLEALIVAAGIYWALTAIFTFFQSKLERRMSRGYVRQVVAPSQRRTRWMSGSAGGGNQGGAMMVEMPESQTTPEELHDD
ncbi:MAG TPA: amino acid ABC transporter permease [Actinomycetota bacterium]